jgi:Tfp pilus assembly protein PilF
LQWLDAQPEDPLVRATLAEHYQQRGDRAAAIAQYERAARVSQGPVLLNNLAWLYYETGDQRALDIARRAYEAAPERAEIADTYGWLLVESGDIGKGLAVLEKAARAAPDVAEIQYHHAAALARAGQKEAAATALKRLIADNSQFPSQREAEALLRTLL